MYVVESDYEREAMRPEPRSDLSGLGRPLGRLAAQRPPRRSPSTTFSFLDVPSAGRNGALSRTHQLCAGCKIYLGILHGEVSCRHCQATVHPSKNIGQSFLYLSLEHQIRRLLETGIITEEDLQYPGTRKKTVQTAIEDIFDGIFYLIESENGKFKTFSFFLDGLTVTDSTKLSAWPLMATINELPPHKRRKHMLLACVWLGKDKPDCNEYLKPFVEECLKLSSVGVKFKVNGVTETLKFRATNCVADSVARPAIQNSTLFSGNFGCSACLHPGEWTLKGGGGMMSYSPLHDVQWGDPEPRWYPRRTHEATLADAEMALETNVRQNGIQGKSILSTLPWFHIVNGLDVDVMHILMNVGKTFSKLWFKEKYDGKPFNICHNRHIVDERLQSFQPTSEVSRSPRSLEHYTDFKAHEWACWILIYSLPALKGVLPTRYCKHWALLVSGLARLTDQKYKKISC